jgi:hypothetical protein
MYLVLEFILNKKGKSQNTQPGAAFISFLTAVSLFGRSNSLQLSALADVNGDES